MRTVVTFLIISVLFSCQYKTNNKSIESFCLNSIITKSQQQCEECLPILDKMYSGKRISRQEYITMKLNYLLILRRYDEAAVFLNRMKFEFDQEKYIRQEEILLVKAFCKKENEAYLNKKKSILLYIDQELLQSKNPQLTEILKNERAAVKSNLIVDYYCSRVKNRTATGVSIKAEPAN